MREALAEFFGTAILITFGVGVVAQTVLSGNTAGSPLGIHLCWGIAVILGVYASAGVSGGSFAGSRKFVSNFTGSFHCSSTLPEIPWSPVISEGS